MTAKPLPYTVHGIKNRTRQMHGSISAQFYRNCEGKLQLLF